MLITFIGLEHEVMVCRFHFQSAATILVSIFCFWNERIALEWDSTAQYNSHFIEIYARLETFNLSKTHSFFLLVKLKAKRRKNNI